MEIPKLDIKVTIKDIVVPLLIALIPFSPNLYNSFTEPEFHFVYESTYAKNPAIEVNRRLDKLLSHISTDLDRRAMKKGLKEEVEDGLKEGIKTVRDAMLMTNSEFGLKAMDRKTVRVVNLSSYDLRNVRVHFMGCAGFDSYETWPDQLGSSENRNILSSRPTDKVTIRYDSLPRRSERSYSYRSEATITFYGADASNCYSTVEADLARGSAAVGKEVNINSFIDDIVWALHRRERLGDITLKVFLAAAVLYMYFQIRSMKKRIRQDG